MKQKLFSFFLTLLSSVSAIYASNTKVDGIWYDFDSSTKTASVTYRGSSYSSYKGEYSGSVTIPETVTYNGTTYSVTSIGENAFYECSKLLSVTIGESVESIGECAFRECSLLSSITVPNSVTSIGERAFQDCSGLESVTIPNSVKSIGGYAFYDCWRLDSVTIGESVESIGDNAFYGCGLESISIPNSVTYIGYGAFHNCSVLCYVTINSDAIVNRTYSSSSSISNIFGSRVNEYIIGEDVKGIGNYAFYGCPSLKSITIAEGVTNIGVEAFKSCSLLSSVTIPNSVTSIADGTFSNCSSLASITIPNSVTSIGDYAFYKCSGLTSITIGENVTSIGDDAFYGCSHLTSIVWNVKKWNDFSALNAPFDAIRSQITSFTFGESVQHIPAYLCYEMSKLTSITIGENVTRIGDDAFYGCSSLTSVVWNATNCADFTSVSAPFYNIRSQITSFTFGESVQYIPAYLCYEMSKLISTTIGESVTRIGGSAFYGCSGLTSITIGESVTSIGSRAFGMCKGLTSVVWNAKNYADFSSNSNSPFYTSRSQITSFTFGESVQRIPAYLCWDMRTLTSITIPNSVEGIGDNAFYYCGGLKSITIGEKVTSIGSGAFGLCSSLTSITIPYSVMSIGDDAFYYCSGLTSIESFAEVPPTLKSNTFKDVSKNIPVYVPCGSVSAYESAEYWKKFTNIQEPLAEHSYSIVINVNDNNMGTARVDKNSICGAQISATPDYGYHFVQWSDGTTENPRALELTQDTTFTAEFAQTYSGQCGDNLYWSFNNNTLTITGSGDMWDERPWGLFGEESKTILFPSGITSIGNSAFDGFINLTSITIPNSVEGIGDYAFQGCSGLTSITIPNSMMGIGQSVFDDCSRLTSVIWNAKNCEVYSYHPFKNIRTQITSFTFGDNVEYIPTYLCEGMSNLTSIKIPNSVKRIGSRAFQLCSGLTSVTVGNGVTRIEDDAFLKCSSLTSLTIGNSVATIGEGAFESCSSLTSITIPNSVTNIKYGAFADCVRLSKVSLGSSISYIGGEVFAGCNRLYDIYCYATNPPEAKESSFANFNANLYVPCESKEDYEYDSFWGKFKFIECIDVESAVDDIPTAITNVQKIFRDDQLLIIRDGKSYNVIGQEIGN